MDFRVIGEEFRFGVRVTAIIRRQGKLLTYKYKDQFHLVGGAIKVGESSREAIVREVEEELGLACQVGALMFVVENRFNFEGELHHMVEFHYEVNLLGDPPKATLDEGDYECQWLNLESIRDMDIRPTYLKEKLVTWQDQIEHVEIDQWTKPI